jgi:hypothetical protein
MAKPSKTKTVSEGGIKNNKNYEIIVTFKDGAIRA